MTNTVQERSRMIPKLQKAGYPLSYIVYVIDEVVDFDKKTKGLSFDEKLNEIKKHRWLGTDLFMFGDAHKRLLEELV